MKTERRSLTVTVVAGLVVMASGVSACGKNDRPAQDASTTPAVVATTEPAQGDASEGEATVQISKQLRERCSLPDSPEGAPRFDYDQSTLRARGENVLDDVAACLKDGPLKGEVVTLVGRADPRGTADYNQDLAASRAAAARNYLAQRGVPNEQMKLMARGESGAQGSGEEGWALDRRVDLELGDLSNSPVLQGSMIQAEGAKKPDNSPEAQKAGAYADVAEGSPPAASGSGK
jgi:outer membrane protein OmpA-like peptidoglycan-associated protein